MKKYIKNNEFEAILMDINSKLIRGILVEQSVIDELDITRNLKVWEYLLNKIGVSHHFLKRKPELLNMWNSIMNFENISEELLLENKDKINNWYYILDTKSDLSSEFIKNVILDDNNADIYLNGLLRKSKNIDCEIIDCINEKFLFGRSNSNRRNSIYNNFTYELVQNPYITEEMIEKYIPSSNYYIYISSMDRLSDEFIIKNMDKLNISLLLVNKLLKDKSFNIMSFIMDNINDEYHINNILRLVAFNDDELRLLLETKFNNVLGYIPLDTRSIVTERQVLSNDNIDYIMSNIKQYPSNNNQTIISNIIKHQRITDQFILKYNDLFDDYNNWANLSKYCRLSDDIICKFRSKLYLTDIMKYQDIRNMANYKKVFGFKDTSNSMLYYSKKDKLELIKKYYEVKEDEDGIKIYSYKLVGITLRSTNYTTNIVYSLNHVVEVNNCDCNSSTDYSFGINSWNIDTLLSHLSTNDKEVNVIKLETRLEDFGCIAESNNLTMRTFKSKVIDVHNIIDFRELDVNNR